MSDTKDTKDAKYAKYAKDTVTGATGATYTGPAPVARSPIRAEVVDGDGALRLTDQSATGKLLLRAPVAGPMAQALGTRFGRAGREFGDEALVVGSGPGEWLVIAPREELPVFTAWLEQRGEADPGLVSVVDVSHGRAMLRLTGHAAADVLAKLCAVDLSDEVVPDGGAFRSSVARVATDVVRDDSGDGDSAGGDRPSYVPSYVLHCERSSGQYLWDAVVDAGREFGVTVVP